MPCGDKDDCNEVNHAQTAQAQDHEHQDEACTPFCVCSCCAAHFLIKDFQTGIDQVAVINTIYTVLPESKITSAIIPIWQPPKLA